MSLCSWLRALLSACLPEGEALERTVDSHVSKRRRKLEDAGVPHMPGSVRGVGTVRLIFAGALVDSVRPARRPAGVLGACATRSAHR